MANENIQELKFQVGEAWKGVYSPSTAYGLANVVQDPTGLSIYRSLKSGNVGHPLSNASWWFRIIDLSSIKAESDRIAALNQSIAQDEALRVAAEELRQQHEAERVAAETQRNEAEQQRISAEEQRVNKESQREAAEQQRITEEQGRVSAESARVQAEQARVLAETLRANAEDQRAANEQNRVAAEQQRIERAEQDHQRAESDHATYVDSLGAFDISSYHATDGVLAKYADLTAALGTNGANIPDALRKGGMSVKFVQSSDNNYVKFFLNAQTFTTDINAWEKMNLEKELTELDVEADAIKGKTKIPVLYSDGYVKTNYPVGTTIDISTYTQNSSYRCLFLRCIPGDVVFLKGQGGESPRLWVFLDADYKIIEVSEEINWVTEINLLAPAGSAFILINDMSNNNSYVLPSDSIEGLLEHSKLEKTALNNSIGYPGLTEILKEIIPYNSVQNIPYEISEGDVIVCHYKYAKVGSNLVIKMRDANNADQAIFDGVVSSSEDTIIVNAVRDAVKFVILSSNGKGTFVEIYKGGDAAVAGLDSIEQTTTSTEDGGVNVITATLKDGTTENFYIRNGRRGSVGPQGIQGPQGNPASTQDYPFQLENTFNGGVSKALTAEKGKNLYEAIAPIRGSQIVNVLDRGAVRNGDIYSVITAIIESFGEDGGVIYVPRGTYFLSNSVLWASNVHIYGDGAGQTIIKPTYSDAFGSPTNTNLENISFRDFTVDGELVSTTSGKAFFFLYVKDAIFKDLEILNTPETGLGVDMFINGVIDNVRCDNCGRRGNLSGNAFGCSGIGIGTGAYERGNESLTISNCHCNNCKQNGIFVERQSGDYPVGTSIIGCTCEGNRNGFGVSGCDNVAFIGCTAYNNHHAGFSYDSGTMHNNTPHGIRPKFIACIAKDNGQNIPEGYPLYDNEINGMGWFIKSNYQGIELVACSSINNLLHGIYSPAGSYGLSVIGGNFENNGGDGIHLSAPQRFRIEPTLVQYNTGNGLYVTGSANFGFFKNFMVLDNSGKGIFFDSVTRWQVTLGDYIAAGNASGNTDGI